MPKTGRGGDRRSGRQFGPNMVRYPRQCQHCREMFNSARPDTRYCKQSCRSAAARDRKHDRELEQFVTDLSRQQAADNAAAAKPKRARKGR